MTKSATINHRLVLVTPAAETISNIDRALKAGCDAEGVYAEMLAGSAAVCGELDGLLADIHNAAQFFQKVKEAAQNGEDCTSTGAWRDANEWLKSAGLAFGSALAAQDKKEG